MPKFINQANPGYTPNSRTPYYEYRRSEYNIRNYPDIKKLINKGIVHWDSTGKLCWRKENNDEMWVCLMHELLWKNNILK